VDSHPFTLSLLPACLCHAALYGKQKCTKARNQETKEEKGITAQPPSPGAIEIAPDLFFLSLRSKPLKSFSSGCFN
jgi:hypothetical protein